VRGGGRGWHHIKLTQTHAHPHTDPSELVSHYTHMNTYPSPQTKDLSPAYLPSEPSTNGLRTDAVLSAHTGYSEYSHGAL
jgi:hypothetical protein